jgi:hypothetical protein
LDPFDRVYPELAEALSEVDGVVEWAQDKLVESFGFSAYPNNRVVMRPSPDISGRPRRQAKKARQAWFAEALTPVDNVVSFISNWVENIFFTDNAGIGLCNIFWKKIIFYCKSDFCSIYFQ